MLFRSRDYIQLTGRANYRDHGAAIGLGPQLLDDPDRANDPPTAARLLASFLKSKEQRVKEALLEDNLKLARKLVNGGSHGLDRFEDAYRIGDSLIASPDPTPTGWMPAAPANVQASDAAADVPAECRFPSA